MLKVLKVQVRAAGARKIQGISRAQRVAQDVCHRQRAVDAKSVSHRFDALGGVGALAFQVEAAELVGVQPASMGQSQVSAAADA